MGLNVRSAVTHPAGRLMAVLYVVSAVLFLLVSGDVNTLLFQLGLTFWRILTILIAVTLIAQPAVAWQAAPVPPRRRLWLQLAVVLTVISYTIFRAQALRSAELYDVLLLGDLTAAINNLDFNLANPLLYIVPALILVLLLGARPAGLGLSLHRSRTGWQRTGLLILVLAFMNVVVLFISFLFAGYTIQEFGRRALGSFLQNGFSEEFLFRGALMTRLIRLSNAPWGIVISSLIFGLWHFPANLPMFDGGVLAAVTFSIISQAMGGIVFAIAMQRGGNLVAPSAIHILSHFNPG
jgi:membrane protease YdiL (CAAX protease family)